MPPFPGACIKINSGGAVVSQQPVQFLEENINMHSHSELQCHHLNIRTAKKKKVPTWENVHILYICPIFIADIFLKNFIYKVPRASNLLNFRITNKMFFTRHLKRA